MSVQKLRLQRGWSQEQLAELSGVSARTIQRIERGQTPSLDTLKALAAVFDVDFAQLRTPTMTDDALAAAPASSPVAAPGWSAQEALAFCRVRRLRGFYRHALIYALVVLVSALSVALRGGGFAWVAIMATVWGAGLAWHALAAFDRLPFAGAAWEKRQVEKILGRKL